MHIYCRTHVDSARKLPDKLSSKVFRNSARYPDTPVRVVEGAVEFLVGGSTGEALTAV